MTRGDVCEAHGALHVRYKNIKYLYERREFLVYFSMFSHISRSTSHV